MIQEMKDNPRVGDWIEHTYDNRVGRLVLSSLDPFCVWVKIIRIVWEADTEMEIIEFDGPSQAIEQRHWNTLLRIMERGRVSCVYGRGKCDS